MTGGARICLCLASPTLADDVRHVEAFRGRVDMVELRADHLAPGELASAGRLPGLVDLPVILTLRRTRDGGRFAGSEQERVGLLERLVGSGFAYVDIEEDLVAPSLDARIAEAGVRVVRSLHDFSGVPSDLAHRIARIPRGPREIPKAAVTPRSSAELAGLLEAFDGLDAPEKVVIGMGDIGFPTRVLASRLGSAWCYTSPTADPVAPGQMDPATLEGLYRFRATDRSTAVYGVIGNPVMHSLSPRIHNRGFSALGVNAVYLPFLVADLPGFWQVADALDIHGVSVTAPYKRSVLDRAGEVDDLVRSVGACNTLVRTGRESAWQGTNTDIEGFLAPLRRVFGGAIPRGLGATVIGAGGAARAVVQALAGAGARVLVLNRTIGDARALADAFGARSGGLDERGMDEAARFSDLIVQTTSVGMGPQIDATPVPGFPFTGRQIAYELIYSPPETRFLRDALKAGCRVVRGRQMLLAQAVQQFRLFAGAEYPPDLADEFLTQGD